MAIKITIEIWPFGFKQFKRTLGEAVIYNDGTGDKEVGNYEARFQTYYRDDSKHTARCEEFSRSNNVWDLLLIALKNRSKSNDDSFKDMERFFKESDTK